jgi:hypothetical protein
MPRELHASLKRILPRWGDRSRLVQSLLQMWLTGQIQPLPGLDLFIARSARDGKEAKCQTTENLSSPN